MKFTAYIRQHIELITAAAGMILLTDLILLSSIPLESASGDMIYLNILMLAAAGAGFFFHYRRIHRAYNKIRGFIEDCEASVSPFDRQPLISDAAAPGIDIMRKISDMNAQSLMEIKENSEQHLNELNNLLTRTVHDIKINLSVCEMAAGRMENKNEIYNKLIYQIKQIEFRVNQLLSISRASCFADDIHAEPIEIKQSVREAVGDNSEFFITKNITIQQSIAAYRFTGDRKWIRYIISQILNNCSKYTPENGKISITGSEEQSAYRLRIKDNGIGIPAQDIQRIFDRGFTGVNGRIGLKSTGMGLYYAAKIADLLGIGLKVESEQNIFTEFTISLYKISDYLRQKG